MIIWDMVCGSLGRPCPKLGSTRSAPSGEPPSGPSSRRRLASMFSRPSIPCGRRRGHSAQRWSSVELLAAFHTAFGGRDDEVNFVDFELAQQGDQLCRGARSSGGTAMCSMPRDMTPIRRV